MPKTLGKDSSCSIARALDALGDAWTILIIREALVSGATRFQEFQDALGIAPNVLAKRLAALVESRVMTRRAYRDAGVRSREEYILTEAGRGLSIVVAALSSWARTYRPSEEGTSPRFLTAAGSAPAQLAFIDERGSIVPPEDLVAVRTPDRERA